MGHGYQKRVDEWWIVKMTNKKAWAFITYLIMEKHLWGQCQCEAVLPCFWLPLDPFPPYVIGTIATARVMPALLVKCSSLKSLSQHQLCFQGLIIDTVGEDVGGLHFWQSSVSISHIWLIKNLARNSSLYSFGNPCLDHKSLNQALSTSLNLQLSFHFPNILPEDWSNRRADKQEYPMVSSHWDSPWAFGEVTFPWHWPQLQSEVRQRLRACSLTPSPCCLASTSLKSHGNISGFLTQGI